MSALLIPAIDSVGDAVLLLEGTYVLLGQPSPSHLIPNGHPVVVQVVLASKDLQIPPCMQHNNMP